MAFDEEVCTEKLIAKLVNKKVWDLSCLRLQKDLWRKAAQTGTKIRKLILDNIDLREHSEELPHLLVKAGVKILSMVNSELRTQNFEALYKKLLEHVEHGETINLVSIGLKYVDIEPEGFEFLALILNQTPEVLEELDLTDCQLNDDAMKKFLEAISEGKVIKKLVLGENADVTPKGMNFVGAIARKCGVLELKLPSCDLTDEHLEELSNDRPQGIKSLCLCENADISEAALWALREEWKSLTEIHLQDCMFGPKEELAFRNLERVDTEQGVNT